VHIDDAIHTAVANLNTQGQNQSGVQTSESLPRRFRYRHV